MERIFARAVLVVAIPFAACGGGGASPCATSGDCPGVMVCIDSRCVAPDDAAGETFPDAPGDAAADADPDGVDRDGPADRPPADDAGDAADVPDGSDGGPPPDGTDAADAWIDDAPPPDDTDPADGTDDDAVPGDADGTTGDVEAADADDDGATEDAVPDGFSTDDDGDTFPESTGDCDDSDPRVHPGATDHIEGIDYDCDGKREYLATFLVTVDDWYERLCVNDVDVAVDPVTSRDWFGAETYTAVMESGSNVVGVHGVDLYEVISAFMMRIQVDGSTFLTSGISPGDPDTTPWRYSPDPDAGPQADWCAPWYDDSAWGPARYVAEWGSSPWGGSPPEFAGVGADWVWDDRPTYLLDAWFRIDIALP